MGSRLIKPVLSSTCGASDMFEAGSYFQIFSVEQGLERGMAGVYRLRVNAEDSKRQYGIVVQSNDARYLGRRDCRVRNFAMTLWSIRNKQIMAVPLPASHHTGFTFKASYVIGTNEHSLSQALHGALLRVKLLFPWLPHASIFACP